ncbi:MAG: SRPBCC family protein, partial [Caldilineaceae bacterium]
MKYHHRFVVNAPLSVVRDFHRQSASMGAITPPPVIVRVHEAPALLGEGDEMAFTMWMGPLPIRWRARIHDVAPYGFRDTLVQGPFTRWSHEHTFVPVDANRTEVFDTLDIELTPYPFWHLVGRMMTLNLPVLFAYRQWRTKRLLDGAPQAAAAAA